LARVAPGHPGARGRALGHGEGPLSRAQDELERAEEEELASGRPSTVMAGDISDAAQVEAETMDDPFGDPAMRASVPPPPPAAARASTPAPAPAEDEDDEPEIELEETGEGDVEDEAEVAEGEEELDLDEAEVAEELPPVGRES